MPLSSRWTFVLLLASLPLLARAEPADLIGTDGTNWADDLGSGSSVAEISSGAEVVPPITEVHLIFPCGGRGTAPFPFPGVAECRRRSILNTDLPQCAEDGFLVTLAETAAISVPSATIISNYSSFTCFDLDSKLAPTAMYSIVDPIIARQSASGRMAIVGYPDYVPAAHDALARAAREGVAVLQFDNDDRIIDHVNFSQDLVLQFATDERQIARQVGVELCRRLGTTGGPLRYVALYTRSLDQDVRITGVIEGFETSCTSRQAVKVAETRLLNYLPSTAQTYMENAFLVDDTITCVLTTSDDSAKAVVAAADAMLAPAAARALFVSGWDHHATITPYLSEDRVFATVDELATQDNVRIWSTIPKMLDLISLNHWRSTADVQAAMPTMSGSTLFSSALVIPSDVEGYIISRLLDSAYNPVVRPLPVTDSYSSHTVAASRPPSSLATVVYVGLDEVVVQEIDVPANTFQATFWMKLQWSDPRLTWISYVYDGTIQVSKEQVWTPELFIQNHLSELVEREAGETLVTVFDDGRVTWARKVTGEFDCTMRIEPYPFDIHTCYLNISTDADVSKVVLDAMTGVYVRGWVISAVPEGFLHEKDGCSGFTCGIREEVTISGPPQGTNWDDYHASAFSAVCGSNTSKLSFAIKFTRDPSYVVNTYVMMAWLLVALSLMQFWIPEESGNMDRAGLAITTVLATVVLMTEGVVSKETTWLSGFFLVCTTYQASAFLTTVVAGRRFGHRAKHDAFDVSEPNLPAVEPPRATCSPTAWAERNSPGLATWRATIMMACEELTGQPEDDVQDLFAIRVLVPSFLLVCVIMPFLTVSTCTTSPRGSADCQRDEHSDAGIHSKLFLTNIVLLVLWCVALVVAVGGRCTRNQRWRPAVRARARRGGVGAR